MGDGEEREDERSGERGLRVWVLEKGLERNIYWVLWAHASFLA